MSPDHPDELELLAHADGDVRSNRAREVAAHVRECPRCAAAVGEARAGRASLRAAPRFQLGHGARAAISAALAGQPPRRPPLVSRARLAAVLAPVVLAAGVAIAVTELRDPGGGEEAGRARTGAPAEAASPGGGQEATTVEQAGEARGTALTASGPIASVAGPATEVVAVLRGEGLTARISGGRVVVSQATPRRIVDALRGRARGRVRVVAE